MRVPQLRKHATGQWFVYWNNKARYLGTDRAVAERRYLDELDDWRDWWAAKHDQQIERRRRDPLRVCVLADRFYAAKMIEVGPAAEKYYRKHLKRFVATFGGYDSDLIEPKHLMAFRLELTGQGLAPKTVNHDLGAAKTLFRWASAHGMSPAMDLAGVKQMPVGPVEDASIPQAQLSRLIRTAPEAVRPWMAVNYLAVLRPSEVVRVVHGEGEWVAPGVFRLDRGKMDRRASIKRHCLLSDLALAWLRCCQPTWSHADGYSHAMRRTCPVGPKVLQKSAASHLVQEHDADPADVELLLGHVKGRLAVTYYQPAWPRLRQVAARLWV